eukprot:XP_001706525.1 Hypothetical protein GL50803_23421 [Giardia lamblia ATCC 50803]
MSASPLCFLVPATMESILATADLTDCILSCVVAKLVAEGRAGVEETTDMSSVTHGVAKTE